MSTVELTQYMRPRGDRRTVTCDVPDPLGALAIEHKVVLSCEVLMSGVPVIYGRMPLDDEEDELCLFASNGPGPQAPDRITAQMIELVLKRAGIEVPQP